MTNRTQKLKQRIEDTEAEVANAREQRQTAMLALTEGNGSQDKADKARRTLDAALADLEDLKATLPEAKRRDEADARKRGEEREQRLVDYRALPEQIAKRTKAAEKVDSAIAGLLESIESYREACEGLNAVGYLDTSGFSIVRRKTASVEVALAASLQQAGIDLPKHPDRGQPILADAAEASGEIELWDTSLALADDGLIPEAEIRPTPEAIERENRARAEAKRRNDPRRGQAPQGPVEYDADGNDVTIRETGHAYDGL